MPHAPRSRWTAALLHAAISLTVIGLAAAGIVLALYPGGLWHAADLHQLLGIMVAADVVLGPLLTFIVYRPGKPGLRFDLTMIALAQAAFLAYGLHTSWLNRPVFLVGSERGYGVVFASEVPRSALDEATTKAWPRFRGHGPWVVGMDLSSEAAREEFMFAFALGGVGPLLETKRHVDLKEVAPAIRAKAQAVPRRIALSPQERAQSSAMVLLSARSAPVVVILDADSAQPVRVVD